MGNVRQSRLQSPGGANVPDRLGNPTWDANASLLPTFRSGNDEFDRIIDEAQVTVDTGRRRGLYARAQRLLRVDATVIPLYQQIDLYAVNRRLRFQALPSEQLVGVWMSLSDGH